MSDDAFERVLTMTDYHDGPRDGIASFRGEPHAYTSPPVARDTDLYELRPVDAETLRLALEDWEIWLRWDAAFHAGLVDRTSHPALVGDRARLAELAPILAARFAAIAATPAIRARGEFRPTPGHADTDGGRSMEVRWTVVGEP